MAVQSVDSGIQVSSERVYAAGKKTGWHRAAYFDGKQYPGTSTPNGGLSQNVETITRYGKRIDDYTFETTRTTRGKAVGALRLVVIKDGKSHQCHAGRHEAQGQPARTRSSWRRQ
jgi:hypothetical protein